MHIFMYLTQNVCPSTNVAIYGSGNGIPKFYIFWNLTVFTNTNFARLNKDVLIQFLICMEHEWVGVSVRAVNIILNNKSKPITG